MMKSVGASTDRSRVLTVCLTPHSYELAFSQKSRSHSSPGPRSNMAQDGPAQAPDIHAIQERADATKEYLERKYAAMKKQREERLQR